MANKARSHRGRIVDMEEIKIKNQEAIAVGNMNVNARGDEIDEYGRVTKPRDEVARERIKQHSTASNSRASVISSFEDDDDMVEIKDDPKAIEKNSKKSQPATTNRNPSSSSVTKQSTSTKDGKDSKDPSQTDLE